MSDKVRTTTRDFRSLVREVDPYDDQSDPPWVYEFSNGRRFYNRPPAYPVVGRAGTSIAQSTAVGVSYDVMTLEGTRFYQI